MTDNRKNRIVIFGTGRILDDYIKEMNIDEIVGFIDNDFNKLYQEIYGRIIIQPSRIKEFSYDYVVIFGQKNRKEMHNQLVGLGVDDERIISWQYYLYGLKWKTKAFSRPAFSMIADIIRRLSVRSALDVENGMERNGFYIAGTDLKNYVSCIDNFSLEERRESNIYEKNAVKKCSKKSYDIILFIDYFAEHTIEEFHDLMRETYFKSKYALVSVPYECPSEWTRWNELDFSQYGVVREFSGRVVKLVLIKKEIPPRAEKKAAIYTVAHKEFRQPEERLFVPVFVGNNYRGGENILKDSTGDHISELNPKINELTALYWIWKNLHTDIAGLCHYRRYFAKSADASDMDFDLVDQDRVEEDLGQYDMIVSNAVCSYPFSLREQLRKTVSEESFYMGMGLVRTRIGEIYPEYLKDFDECFQGFVMYPCNMFIAGWNVFSNYCEWLFRIVTDAARKIDVSGFDSYSQRIIGFIAERLLTVWIRHNNIKIKEYPVLMSN